jgi:hypothetical protein
MAPKKTKSSKILDNTFLDGKLSMRGTPGVHNWSFSPLLFINDIENEVLNK